MNKQEAAKLLSLIKLSYPASYRDIDKETANATVTMWAMSFPEVPYAIMEKAFNHYRMTHKFPPTVAEVVEELGKIYYQALECANVQKNLGNEEGLRHFRAIMSYTDRYKDPENLGTLQVGDLPKMLGGDYYGKEKENGPAYYGLHSGPEGRNELWNVEGPPSSY